MMTIIIIMKMNEQNGPRINKNTRVCSLIILQYLEQWHKQNCIKMIKILSRSKPKKKIRPTNLQNQFISMKNYLLLSIFFALHTKIYNNKCVCVCVWAFNWSFSIWIQIIIIKLDTKNHIIRIIVIIIIIIIVVEWLDDHPDEDYDEMMTATYYIDFLINITQTPQHYQIGLICFRLYYNIIIIS